MESIIDRVYQKVLALANKEQRGYVTPQEFNLFAHQAQLDIFEQYVYDINQFKRGPGNDSKISDMVDLLKEKLYFFTKTVNVSNNYSLDTITNLYQLSDIYSIPNNYTSDSWLGGSSVVEEISVHDLVETQRGPLTRATINRPVYYIENNTIFIVPSQPISNYIFKCTYLEKPKTPKWTYITVGTTALFNPNSDYQDFELHPSEENNLVIKILQMVGINLKDPSLTQAASQEEIKNIQQQKQ